MTRAAAGGALLVVGLASLGCDAGDVAYIGRQQDAVLGADASVSADACAAVPAPVATDYCAVVPKLASPPVLDGALECGLSLAAIDPRGWRGVGARPADLAVEYAVAWRPDGLYAFVHVKEAQRLPAAPAETRLYCGDATHVFVDDDGRFAAPPAYDEPGTRQLLASAPADDHDSVARGTVYTPAGGAPWNGRFRAFPTPDGYVVEMFVTGDDLGRPGWTLIEGGRIGLDLSIGYGGTPSEYPDATCPKLGDFVLRRDPADAAADDGMPHSDTNAFCTPGLTP